MLLCIVGFLQKWLAAVVLEALLWEARSSSTQRHVRVLASLLGTLRVGREDRAARQSGVDVEHELRATP